MRLCVIKQDLFSCAALTVALSNELPTLCVCCKGEKGAREKGEGRGGLRLRCVCVASELEPGQAVQTTHAHIKTQMSFLFIKSGFTHRKGRRKRGKERKGGKGKIADTRRTAYCTINTHTTLCHTLTHTHTHRGRGQGQKSPCAASACRNFPVFLFFMCRALTSRQRVCACMCVPACVPACVSVCV